MVDYAQILEFLDVLDDNNISIEELELTVEDLENLDDDDLNDILNQLDDDDDTEETVEIYLGDINEED